MVSIARTGSNSPTRGLGRAASRSTSWITKARRSADWRATTTGVCVGFTYRVTKEGDTSCFHFENEENKEGPTRDMRSNTYSKCAQFQVPAAPESQALDSKDEESLDPASADESDAA